MADQPVRAGAHERRLAVGAAAQQVSQVSGTLIMLAVVTVVGRTLSLPEFGVYGLLISISTYLMIAQISVEGAAVKAVGAALDKDARDRAFSVALSLYTVAGLIGGLLLAGGGTLLLGILNIPGALEDEAQVGILALGAVTAVGWPCRTFQDVLRGDQRFVLSASAEIVGFVVFGALTITLLLIDAPLWTLIAAGGSMPGLIGLGALVVTLLAGGRAHYRPALITRESVREFTGLSGYLAVNGIADLVIYSLDRAILGGFKSASVVGLYEGPIRAHNLVRQVTGTLAVVVLPVAARYVEEGDQMRVRELLLRGTRYVVALVVPATVILMVLAEPVLHVWLGERFEEAATAMTILVSYWLVASSTAVAAPMLIAAGRARLLAVYAVAVAVTNLTLSLALTPSLGLEGVTLGTAIPYLLLQPLLLVVVVRVFPISVGDLARSVWLPAFSLAIPLAGALVALRAAFGLESLLPLLAVAAGGFAAYLIAYGVIFLNQGERTLLRSFVRRPAV